MGQQAQSLAACFPSEPCDSIDDERAQAVAQADCGESLLEAPSPRRWRELHACVAALLEFNCGVKIPMEKRTGRRTLFRKPLVITPINKSTGRPDATKSFAAFGIDISPTGIGFLARNLVPSRQAVVSCEGPENRSVNLLFEPRWVRFTRGGWYQTGGRLLEVLPDNAPPVHNLRVVEPPSEDDESLQPSGA